MDLCTGGELFDRICEVGQFFEKDAVKIIHTVLGAVTYLHGLNVVHRDLKPENLLFQDKSPNSNLLIADFGLSKLLETDQMDNALKTTCGTPGYMAPEVLQKTGHGKPVDLWSIGVMAYFLLCGYMPFETKTEVVDLNLVMKGEYIFDEMYWKDVSQSAKDFIMSIMIVDPKKRLNVEQALKHPWMRDSFPIPSKDLFPNVRAGFNARKTFKKAVDVVKAVNKLSVSSLSSKTKSALSIKSDEGAVSFKSTYLNVANPNVFVSTSPATFSSTELGRDSHAHADDLNAHLENTLLADPGSQDLLHRAKTK